MPAHQYQPALGRGRPGGGGIERLELVGEGLGPPAGDGRDQLVVAEGQELSQTPLVAGALDVRREQLEQPGAS